MASNRDENAGYQPYTPDEFDDPPEGPVGVHRGPRSVPVRAIPFVVIVLLAVLCGLGAWTVFSGGKMFWQHNQTSQVQSARTQSANSGDKSGKTATPSAKQTQAPSPTATASTPASAPAQPAANKATQVRVVNGTSIAGYAASKRQTLLDAGYTNVNAANPAGQLPAASVVWYLNEADKATAEDVAKTLGIASVEQSASAAAPVVAVLLN
ncbi:hypothetical protein KIM372_06580 [Bombiscardovia nodaiensis]|uniref:LytR/CpsA/Psr regulator C-terminal domain-containing protein n=1 Tax=Bombiscardovia nodaiensis TaxID=2932181 RepID=A0ABN6S994_9BIFI|nr:hypothetical protein KIM372_06580 [Bombiscardovia nodaiensis]